MWFKPKDCNVCPDSQVRVPVDRYGPCPECGSPIFWTRRVPGVPSHLYTCECFAGTVRITKGERVGNQIVVLEWA